MFASGARATNEQEEEGGKEEDKMEGKQMSVRGHHRHGKY